MISVSETLKTTTITPAYKMPNPENVAKILEELCALEKNVVQNWNIIYPTLWAFLQTTVTEICAPLNCPVPAIIIDFRIVQSQQASAHIMTDGSTQLYIGSDLIKRSLILDADAKSAPAYRSFRWVIAHEIGHLCDPKFKMFGRSFALRNIADKIAQAWLGLGMINMLWPASKTIVNLPQGFLIAAASFIILKKIFIMALQRSWEYSADRIALQALQDFDANDMQNALNSMIGAMKPLFASDPSSKLNLFFANYPSVKETALYKKVLKASYFYAHPSTNKRIAHIKRITSKI